MLLQLGTFMSAAPAPSTTVSLADEEAVRRILVDTLFEALGDGQQPEPPASIAARPLSRDGVRIRAPRAGPLGLRGSQADVLGAECYELRHHYGWRPGSDAGRQRRGAGGADKPRGAEHRHPGALAVRTRREPFRRASLRARDVLHPAASLRAHVRRVTLLPRAA